MSARGELSGRPERASLVSPSFFATILLQGPAYGFDFDPVSDLIRIVSTVDVNLRVSPNTGLLVQVDTSLDNPGPGGSPFNYGRLFRKADIDAALKKSDPYVALGYGPDPSEPAPARGRVKGDPPVNGIYRAGSDLRKDGEAVGW